MARERSTRDTTLPELLRAIATDARAASRIVEASPEIAREKLVVEIVRMLAASR